MSTYDLMSRSVHNRTFWTYTQTNLPQHNHDLVTASDQKTGVVTRTSAERTWSYSYVCAVLINCVQCGLASLILSNECICTAPDCSQCRVAAMLYIPISFALLDYAFVSRVRVSTCADEAFMRSSLAIFYKAHCFRLPAQRALVYH